MSWFNAALARAAALLSALTDRLAAWIAPITPWLFIALARAWIPTLIAAVAAAMFWVVPQSREVLHGLGEPVLQSLADFDYGKQRDGINGLAWAFYAATALVLGASVWYSARLLATVGAEEGTPAVLEPAGTDSQRLARATTWYPRWLGAAVLGAAVGALVYANYTPRLTDAFAISLAALTIAGPWLLAIGGWLRAHKRDASRWGGWLAAGAVVTAAASTWLVIAHVNTAVRAAMLGCSLLPGALWLLLANRRNWMQARGQAPSDAAASRRFGSVIVSTVLLALSGSAVLLLMALLPPFPIRAFGSAATVLVFLSATCVFASAGQIWLRHLAREVPGLATAILVVALLLVAKVGKEGLGEESLPPPAADAAALAPAAVTQGPPPGERTMFVNAHGGGLRAAVFTALVLAQADDASCGEFGRRLAAASGVSGGSVGIAIYLVARQELAAAGKLSSDCATRAELVYMPLTDIVATALVKDHLSPVIGRMLAVDAPHVHFGHGPTRGQALLDSWNGALVDGLVDRLERPDRGRSAGLALPLAQLHGGLNPPPAVYFNATDADSGHTVWFSNSDQGSIATQKKKGAARVSVGQAILHSARFPIVTPAGRIEPPWKEGTLPTRLVDGGYTDNSGATTLLDLARSGAALSVNINGNPAPVADCTKAATEFPPIVTAIRGLLQARTAHAEMAVARLEAFGAGNTVDVRFDLAGIVPNTASGGTYCERIRRAEQPPLGWYMSNAAAVELLRSAREGAFKLCAALKLTCIRMPELPPPDA